MSILSSSTNTVSETVSDLIDEWAEETLKISIPAVVTSTSNYASTQCVDVKTMIKSTYDDDITTAQLNMQNIFVKLPEGNGFQIRLPIAVGDFVTLHFTHRCLDSWLEGSGGSVSEDIGASFGNKDCYATHGFGTRNSNQSPSTTDLIITGNGITITLKPDGSYTTVANSTKLTCPTNEIIGDISQTGNYVMEGAQTVSGLVTAGSVTSGDSHMNDDGMTTTKLKFDDLETDGSAGVSGTYTADGHSLTIKNGIVTHIG